MKRLLLGDALSFLLTTATYGKGFYGKGFDAERLKFGPKIGMNNAKISNHFEVYDNFSQNRKTYVGFHIGAFGEYKINEKIGLQLGLQYSKQGQSYKKEFERNCYKAKNIQLVMNYVELPILLRIYPKPTRQFGISIGPKIGFLNSIDFKGQQTEISTGDVLYIKDFDYATQKNYNDKDVSLVLGVDYELPFGLIVAANYSIGLEEIRKDDIIDKNYTKDKKENKHQVFQMSLAYNLAKLMK